MSTFTDEYGNEYVAPYIPNKIVGFQGIDPSSMGPELVIKQWWDDYKKLMLHNGSEGDGSEEETIPISHEQLDELYGGDAEGHYHLTEGEYTGFTSFLADKNAGKYDYPLTEEDYTKLTQVLEAVKSDDPALLSEDEYRKIVQIISTVYDESSEDAEPHVFLSEDEYSKFGKIITVLFPDEDNLQPVFPATGLDEQAVISLINTHAPQSTLDEQAVIDLINTHAPQNTGLDEQAVIDLINTHAPQSTGLDEQAVIDLIDARIPQTPDIIDCGEITT